MILAVLAIWAAPLHAQQPSSDYEAAVIARRAGDLAGALALLDRWIAGHPQDSDALVQRGYVHLALGDRQRAEGDFRAALTLAPAYEDARAGLALVNDRRSDAPPGFVIAGGSFSDLDGGARDW